mmetsp:Transcript_109979/g.262202  ORF Transcript_109979/g.262202 Transcript_109979/m.262202 type:complete len:245 (+) Transcript_109979:178-912(+)
MHGNDAPPRRILLRKSIRDRNYPVDVAAFQNHLRTDIVGSCPFHHFDQLIRCFAIVAHANLAEHGKADVDVGCFCLNGSLPGDMLLLPDANVHSCPPEDSHINTLAGSNTRRQPHLCPALAPSFVHTANFYSGKVLLHIVVVHPEHGHGILHFHIGAVDDAEAELQLRRPLVGVFAPGALPGSWRALAPGVPHFHHPQQLAIHLDLPRVQDTVCMRRLQTHLLDNVMLGLLTAFLCAAHAHQIP